MTHFTEATREALEFLRSRNHVGMIATVDEGGQPFLSPVYYIMGEKFDLYFVTTKETHKARNIKTNSKVAFSVGTGPEYISVMIRGRASLIDHSDLDQVLPAIAESFEKSRGENWPIRKLDDLRGQRVQLFKITPEKVVFLNINSTQEPQSNTDHLYHLVD